MQRFAAVWHASPQKMVGVLFALLLAAMMAVGSGANFNTTSANPGNIVTAGNLKSTNTGALANIDKIKPGETRSLGTVTLKNDGDIDGVFTLAKTVTADSTGPANPFANRLTMKVVDTSVTPNATVYNGPLSTMPAQGLGTWAPGDQHVYAFSVTFLDNTTGGVNGLDNLYKGAAATVRLDWEGVNTP